MIKLCSPIIELGLGRPAVGIRVEQRTGCLAASNEELNIRDDLCRDALLAECLEQFRMSSAK
jgi:hypothetical protein